jgi:predicted RNase H-like HicB family nuclease
MRSGTEENGGDGRAPVEITLRKGEDLDVWIAEDVATGITSQDETREEALANLDEAIAGLEGAGEAPSDDELEALGIDPDANTSDKPTESDPFDL